MDLRKKQADEYIKEAKLTLLSAKAVFEKAKESDLDLWSHVVKSCYDAMEQAMSSILAFNDKIIPKQHPAKATAFLNLVKPAREVRKTILYWLGKRGSAQYIDIRGDKIVVPHEIFDEDDAEKAIEDSETMIEFCKELIEKSDEKSKPVK